MCRKHILMTFTGKIEILLDPHPSPQSQKVNLFSDETK